ncbi:hypothetical protein BH11PLA1_BH11PLA1_20610 [soil metagenome]
MRCILRAILALLCTLNGCAALSPPQNALSKPRTDTFLEIILRIDEPRVAPQFQSVYVFPQGDEALILATPGDDCLETRNRTTWLQLKNLEDILSRLSALGVQTHAQHASMSIFVYRSGVAELLCRLSTKGDPYELKSRWGSDKIVEGFLEDCIIVRSHGWKGEFIFPSNLRARQTLPEE